MPEFRDQPKLRLMIGAVLSAIVWALYVVRVTLGVGPMHDHNGIQAPALHYLLGALMVTGMVAVWIIVRALMMRGQRPNEKPPERGA
jgi:membrane-bound metal-dependent hydrolase YbcI (DUF457 family)